MASKVFLIAILVTTIAAPSLATDYMVGDDAGWKVGVNYTAWAAGKEFYIGDTLMFMYQKGSENVLKVNATEFQQCLASNTSGALTSGNDIVTLAKPGKRWYISGVDDHCSKGVKLVVTVSEAPAPTPVPTLTPGSSGASELSPLKSCAWILAALAVFKMILA
ncbi:Uclacyanin 1 [Forsythia ovata]|uniref:Uclacyanin 1 n=1 Tax=Forsythia ovata TaxID=205694 RepID=A0ABD1W2L3_9LAMI